MKKKYNIRHPFSHSLLNSSSSIIDLTNESLLIFYPLSLGYPFYANVDFFEENADNKLNGDLFLRSYYNYYGKATL